MTNAISILDNVMTSIEDGSIDIYYNKGDYAAVIIGDNLDYAAYILDTDGEKIWEGEFGFSTGFLPPSAYELTRAYDHHINNNTPSPYHSIAELAKKL